MAGLVVAGLTTWQYEGTTAKKKHEHRISYLTGGGLLMEGQEARPTGLALSGAGRGTHAVCGSACLLGVTRRVVSACSPGLRHGLGRTCPALPRLTPWATEV